VGAAPIPRKLLQKGVRDMVRISDARMSGTSYGTVALHVSPEAEAGGPLALVQDGDEIELDVPNRRLNPPVPTRSWPAGAPGEAAPAPLHTRLRPPLPRPRAPGHEGCDFDFLRGKDPGPRRRHRRPSHS